MGSNGKFPVISIQLLQCQSYVGALIGMGRLDVLTVENVSFQ